MNKFKDRHHAGIILATQLHTYKDHTDVIVLALPRGGVPVAYEVANQLNVPLELFIVRKLGVPGYEELAMGAIATGGLCFFNQEIINQMNLSATEVEGVVHQEQQELARRENVYRHNKPFPDLKHKTVILIDDGVATGATMRVAVNALRHHSPHKIIIAVPVAAYSTYEEMTHWADDVICLLKPKQFNAVGLWYDNFSQTTDEEVFTLLEKKHDDF